VGGSFGLLAASGEAKGAIRYLPESTEVVLKAARIAQLRIDRVEAPAWGGLLMREARARDCSARRERNECSFHDLERLRAAVIRYD
jgi:hypothetical protein